MSQTNFSYFADLIRERPVRTAIILGLFLGYLTGTAGLALWPRVTRLSAPLICPSGLQLESEHYAIVNGERGVNRHFYCEATPGERVGVNLKVMVGTGLVYSGIFSGLLGGVFFFLRKLLSR